jgi:hypothetical protein
MALVDARGKAYVPIVSQDYDRGIMDMRRFLARHRRFQLWGAIAREDKHEVLELLRVGALDEKTLLAVIDLLTRPQNPRTRLADWQSRLLAAEVLVVERGMGKREAAIAEVMKRRKVSRRRVFIALRDTGAPKR